MYSLNKFFNTKKKIYLSSSTFEEQYIFKDGLNQLNLIFSMSKNLSLIMKDITYVIYKKTMIGIIFETTNELFLITPIISSISSQFKFIDIIISLNIKKE